MSIASVFEYYAATSKIAGHTLEQESANAFWRDPEK